MRWKRHYLYRFPTDFTAYHLLCEIVDFIHIHFPSKYPHTVLIVTSPLSSLETAHILAKFQHYAYTKVLLIDVIGAIFNNRNQFYGYLNTKQELEDIFQTWSLQKRHKDQQHRHVIDGERNDDDDDTEDIRLITEKLVHWQDVEASENTANEQQRQPPRFDGENDGNGDGSDSDTDDDVDPKPQNLLVLTILTEKFKLFMNRILHVEFEKYYRLSHQQGAQGRHSNAEQNYNNYHNINDNSNINNNNNNNVRNYDDDSYSRRSQDDDNNLNNNDNTSNYGGESIQSDAVIFASLTRSQQHVRTESAAANEIRNYSGDIDGGNAGTGRTTADTTNPFDSANQNELPFLTPLTGPMNDSIQLFYETLRDEICTSNASDGMGRHTRRPHHSTNQEHPNTHDVNDGLSVAASTATAITITTTTTVDTDSGSPERDACVTDLLKCVTIMNSDEQLFCNYLCRLLWNYTGNLTVTAAPDMIHHEQQQSSGVHRFATESDIMLELEKICHSYEETTPMKLIEFGQNLLYFYNEHGVERKERTIDNGQYNHNQNNKKKNTKKSRSKRGQWKTPNTFNYSHNPEMPQLLKYSEHFILFDFIVTSLQATDDKESASKIDFIILDFQNVLNAANETVLGWRPFLILQQNQLNHRLFTTHSVLPGAYDWVIHPVELFWTCGLLCWGVIAMVVLILSVIIAASIGTGIAVR